MAELRETAMNDSAGLTFGELRRFVQDAMRLGVEDNQPVQAEIKFSGRLKSVAVRFTRMNADEVNPDV